MNKGVIVKVLPKDEMPRDSKGNLFDIIINPTGVPSRKNAGQLIELFQGKVVKHVSNYVQTLIKQGKYKKAIQEIARMYKLMLPESAHQKQVLKSLESLTKQSNAKQMEEFITQVNEHGVQLFVDPADKQSVKLCLKAMAYYGLKPKEKIYDPVIGGKTKNPVTFGYMYWEKTVHQAAKKLSARSIGAMQAATGQAKRVSGESGQRIDELSIATLLSYDIPAYLTEISTLSSDDLDSKYKAIASIYKNGKIRLADLEDIKSTTSAQLQTILASMGVVKPDLSGQGS